MCLCIWFLAYKNMHQEYAVITRLARKRNIMLLNSLPISNINA